VMALRIVVSAFLQGSSSFELTFITGSPYRPPRLIFSLALSVGFPAQPAHVAVVLTHDLLVDFVAAALLFARDFILQALQRLLPRVFIYVRHHILGKVTARRSRLRRETSAATQVRRHAAVYHTCATGCRQLDVPCAAAHRRARNLDAARCHR